MAWRLVAICASLVFGLAAGCGDDDPQIPVDSLPQRPQILPNELTGILGFDLTVDTEIHVVDVVFINGGKDDLVINDIRVEGRDAAAFVQQVVTPDTRVVKSREALAVRLAFTPNGRNVYLGTLIVESNAENFPSFELELVGPGAGARVADAADIFFFETSLALSMQARVDVPVAWVRFYNLGGSGPDANTATLVIDAFTLSNSNNFVFLSDTEVPGAVCDVAGVCAPDMAASETQGCCGQLACRGICDAGPDAGNACFEPCPDDAGVGSETCDFRCEAVRVVSGSPWFFGVRLSDAAPSGGADSTVTIHSNDPDEPQAVITIDGTP